MDKSGTRKVSASLVLPLFAETWKTDGEEPQAACVSGKADSRA